MEHSFKNNLYFFFFFSLLSFVALFQTTIIFHFNTLSSTIIFLLPFLQLCGGNTHPHTLFLNQSQHNPLAPSFSLNMVFFFLRFNSMLKTRKRGLSSRGYQWINVMVRLFGQVAKNKKCLSHIKSCMFT